MNKKFAERLNELIRESGMLKKEVAHGIGINPVTLSRYIGGHQEPKADIVIALANYFGVSVEWLLGESNEKYPAERKVIDFSDKDQVVTMLLDFAAHLEKNGLPATYVDLKKVFEEYDHIQWGDRTLTDTDIRYIVKTIKGIVEGD